jgi:glycosyltransferase involved in cell wall biosynthesis
MKALGVVGNGFAYRMLDSLTRLLYRNSFACLAQSEEIMGHALQNGSKQAMLYRTGVDTALFLPKKDYRRTSTRLRLVYAGTFGLAHGLLRLCQHIDFGSLGAELHIYGDGVERDALVEHIASRNDIYWHGGLPNADIPALLPQFDAALVCQKVYLPGTLPSKIYEALACGLPVLFHGEGEGRKIVIEAGGLHSLPTDFEAFKANISQFVHASPKFFDAIGKKGRAMAEAQFSRQKQIEALVDLLSQQGL